MAEMKLYTIFDKLAGEHGPVFEAKNDLVAARSFAHALKGAPAIDYDLFQVGYRVLIYQLNQRNKC